MSADAKATLRAFADHVAAAQLGDMFQIGEMYDPLNGWRVYVRVGGKALAMSAKEARRQADLYETRARQPEFKAVAAWARDNARTLRECALVVVRKNRVGVVPEGYAEAMPTAGRA